MTSTIDHVAEVNDSYAMRILNGDKVYAARAMRVSYENENGERSFITVPAGHAFTAVGNDYNAGSRGIEVYVVASDGYGAIVSTGALTTSR